MDKKCDRIRGNIDTQILLEPLTLEASTGTSTYNIEVTMLLMLYRLLGVITPAAESTHGQNKVK